MTDFIHHIQLDHIDSTQTYLRDLIRANKSEDENILITTERQTRGHGRNQKNWIHFKNSLAFSMTLRPHLQLALTSLEVGVLICQFFNKEFGIEGRLKWPNDIFSLSGKKAGGIVINNDSRLVVGIGLNLSQSDPDHFLPNFKYSFLGPNRELQLRDYHHIPYQICSFIHNNRILNSSEICEEWIKKCYHINRSVRIHLDQKELCGKFLGLGANGEAKIETNGTIEEFFTGNLFIND